MNLKTESRKALDVGRNGGDIGSEIRNVHLQPDAIDRDTTAPEVFHHPVDRVGFEIYFFRFRIVVEQQRLGVGFVSPAETTLYVCVGRLSASFLRASFGHRATSIGRRARLIVCDPLFLPDSGLVTPESAA